MMQINYSITKGTLAQISFYRQYAEKKLSGLKIVFLLGNDSGEVSCRATSDNPGNIFLLGFITANYEAEVCEPKQTTAINEQ